jgi:hypothetical protein
VIIGIGSAPYTFAANQIEYVIDESFNPVMAIMIAILGFVIVLSLICIVLTACGCGRRPQSTSGSVAAAAPYRPVSTDETKSMKSSAKASTRQSKTSETSGVQVKAVRKKSEFDGDGGCDNAVYENVEVAL